MGASTYQFIEQQNESINALSMFCNKYEPATKQTHTDTFSGREIIRLVCDHTGVNIPLPELNKMLTDMHYQYELDDDEFKWMVQIDYEELPALQL